MVIQLFVSFHEPRADGSGRLRAQTASSTFFPRIFGIALPARGLYTPDVVDTESKLTEFLAMLRAAPWVAVDTEADSLHAYPEKVCLIQISTVAGERRRTRSRGLELAAVARLAQASRTHRVRRAFTCRRSMTPFRA